MASGDDSLQTKTSVDLEPESDGLATYVLTVTAGPDRGASLEIDGTSGGVLVGQSPACSFRLSDHEVSRRHVALELTPKGLRVTDLGSTNGTYVDRVRVIEAELFGDEILRVGTSAIRIERREDGGHAPPLATRFGSLVGSSAAMRRLYPLCERLSASTVPVVIEGETGTGKEVLAESLHESGPRADRPFVIFDCTAVPANLVESELFGHERGAFTGAVATRKGLFEQANGGTLFIDEIGDLDLQLQPKLLRALERGEVRRVGDDRWIQIDVRVLAATRRDLDREVEMGRFRDDLFHRLAVTRIELPPLRRRQGDVEILARHFWSQLGGDDTRLTKSMLARWSEAQWRGNVRELRNAVARQIALGDLASEPRAEIESALTSPANESDLIDRILSQNMPFPEARDALLEAFQTRFIERSLALHGGDSARAANAAGIGIRYFQKLRAKIR